MISECIGDLTRKSQPPVNPITLEYQRCLPIWNLYWVKFKF